MEKLNSRYDSKRLLIHEKPRLLIFLFFPLLLIASLIAVHFTSSPREEQTEQFFISTLSNNSISKFLKDITLEPHVAGTPEDFATASYVRGVFESSGIPSTRYSDYEVLLSYPVHRELSVLLPNGSSLNLSLKEDELDEDPYTSNPRVIPTFLAYSASGSIAAEVVYVNYGRDEDFEALKRRGVEVSGAIALARLGSIYRGDIVGNAAAAGAVGAVLFSDPRDYAANGTQGYFPSSQWLPPSGVQRGTLLITSGDPLTPGWASVSSAERLEESEVLLPKIPALPISARDALPILASLGGELAPESWQGGLGLDYRLGRGPVKLNLTYEGSLKVVPVRNVIGVIPGSEEPDRYVLLGNHRDAWTFGATDPNSGTASLLEVVRGLGKLLERGWKPKRTILLCSWDAEEYGLVGSTEWVEQNLDLLGARAIAYINVDHAVSGPNFEGSTTPQLDNLLLDVLKQVKDPNRVYETVYDSWRNVSGLVSRLGGGGSDFSPFLQHAGVPSFDLRYQKGFPVYHSLYDDYNWMANFGDPLFHRHVAVSAICGLLVIRLASEKIIPLNYSSYADALKEDANYLKTELLQSTTKSDMNPLFTAISELESAANKINAEADAFQSRKQSSSRQSASINDRLFLAERSLLDPAGLTVDPWYRHLIYGPTTHNRYGSQSFPGIWEALATAVKKQDIASQKLLQHEVWKVSRAISNAALVLFGDLR